ncbi:MAG: NAD(P)-dependent alcohol dehydrogenase [Ilumatobacter sp.]
MEAWTQHRYGDASKLALATVPVPVPADDEVLVDVAATSINAADRYFSDPALLMRPMLGGMRRPKSPIGGLDAAGTVVAVGSGVDRFEVGDRVFGDVGGGYGAFTAARHDRLAQLPDSVSFEQAGGVPVAGLTALQGLRDVAGLESGQRVLVNGASGGVGTFAVQVAAAMGADVVAVCSTPKLDEAKSLGASEVVDYTAVDVIDDFVGRGDRFDVLFDVAGVHSVRDRAKLMTDDGCCVFVGAPSGGSVFGPLLGFAGMMIAGKLSSGEFKSFTAKSDGDDMAVLAEMMERGQVRTVVEDVLPFAELPEAVRRFAAGHLAGKLVVAG